MLQVASGRLTEQRGSGLVSEAITLLSYCLLWGLHFSKCKS